MWFSHCPKCKKRLMIKNLVPIVSYFLQGWKCEYCHKPISKFYPILEISSGIVFVGSGILLSNLWIGDMVFWIVINRLLLLMLIYDFQKYELHVPIWIWALAVSLGSQFVWSIWDYGWAFWSSLSWWIVFYGIYRWAKKYAKQKYPELGEWMWEWDVWLAFLMWTLLPVLMDYQSIQYWWIAIFEILILFLVFSSLLGIVYYLWVKLVGENKKKSDILIPFLPFMIGAFWIMLLFWNFFIKLVFVWW